MLHGYPGYHLTPTRRGGAPPHYARCCKCVWCRGIRSALQTGLAPCHHIGDAGSLSLTPGAPSAPAGQNRGREECTPAAWSLNPSCAAQEEKEAGEETGYNYTTHSLPHTHTHIHADIYLSFLHIKHTAYSLLALLLSCSPSFSCSPSPSASSHIQSSHWRASKDSPSLLLCLTLLLQQLLLSLSFPLGPCQVHATCFIGA